MINFLMHRALLPGEAVVGAGLILEHYGLGVVIHPNVTIGRNCRIYHHVTIAGEVAIGAPERVTIGDNVMIGAGAVILPRSNSSLRIGNNVAIGANAVVTKDIPDNAVVAGIPAKVIRMRDTS
ncbi:MAG: serine O-acetyltransferase [Aureliella sp.]